MKYNIQKCTFLCTAFLFILNIADAQKNFRLKKLVNKKSESSATVPISVVEVPTGNFVMGNLSDTSSILKREQSNPLLISGFYISEAEVTNAQYREFVDWVRDSVVARTLGGEYISVVGNDTTINWKKASKINYADANILTKISALLIDPLKTIGQKRNIDPEKLVYLMEGFNYQEAAKKENKGRNPNEFIYRYPVSVYPDTLCWMRDFGYSNNEQMAVSYYNSARYQNHPVVGVGWKQANAFCDWMTKHKIYVEQTKNKIQHGGKCRLPTEAEWEYAASLNEDKNNTSSVKPKKAEDNTAVQQTLFPSYVTEGKKGKIGLYNMADNVSEWTVTSYYEGGENFQNRFNPDIQWGTPGSESRAKRRKVVRGGSWKDTPIMTTVNNRSYEDMDAAHSYLGFRIVVNLPQ